MLYQREIDDSVLIQFIILFTLYNADAAMTYADLMNIVLDTCNIKYTDFQTALYNLKTTEHIRGFMVSEHVEMYEITERGENVSDFFKSSVPVYIREPILDAIKQHFLEKRKKEAVQSRIRPVNYNDYRAECALYDDDKMQLMELKLFAGSRADAERMAKSFKAHYAEIYDKILRIMTENYDD